MVGGGREGLTGVNNSTNLFTALRKKKKVPKSKAASSKAGPDKELEAQVFWAPAPLTTKSWADVDDEDDDDYYATTAPPPTVWSSSEPQHAEEKAVDVEESESDDDLLDEGDDDIEDEHEVEVLVPPEPVEEKPVVKVVHKEPERQLSKKEIKKKELEELDALLADFAVVPKENGHDESNAVNKKTDMDQEEEEKKESGGISESKAAKKKKKKEKSKEAKNAPSHPAVSEAAEDTGPGTEEDASSLDVKERLKKVASLKKKKSSKEMDSSAKAAAQEAAARRAKLAAAKKKEKSHYNQQPIR